MNKKINQWIKKIKSPTKQGRTIRASLFFVVAFVLILICSFLLSREEVAVERPPELSKEEKFIQKIGPYAKQQQVAYQVLPSITIAQAILESDWGESQLSKENNNFFGIKGSEEHNTVLMKTAEFVNDEWIEVEARFRKYDSWKESVDDHAKLFLVGTTWNPDQYVAVRNATSYQQAANALQEAGYATDPTYAQKLIELIKQYQLDEYDH